MIFPLFQQHFSTNRRNSIPSRKLLFYHAKLGYYHGNSQLLPDSTIFPQSPLYQRHIKHKKWGSPTTVMNPTKPRNPLILSHFPILLPSSTQNPMTSIGNCRLCRCESLMTFTPGVKDLPLLPHLCGIYPTLFCDSTNRQNPYFSVRQNRIKAALKAVPVHATPPYLMRSALYQTAKNGYRGKMITAFPHFQLLRRSLRLRPNTVSL